MTSDELRPCPFCGGEAYARYLSEWHEVKCKSCPAVIQAYNPYAAAVDWNRRAEPTAELISDPAPDIMAAVKLNERVHTLEKWAQSLPKEYGKLVQDAEDNIQEMLGDYERRVLNIFERLDARIIALETDQPVEYTGAPIPFTIYPNEDEE